MLTKSPDVAGLPTLTLTHWSLWKTDRDELHAVGRAVETGLGQVSSALRSFDRKTMTGLSSSGRRYVLKGRPGTDLDAMFTFNAWLEMHRVPNYRDVTEAYYEPTTTLTGSRSRGGARAKKDPA